MPPRGPWGTNMGIDRYGQAQEVKKWINEISLYMLVLYLRSTTRPSLVQHPPRAPIFHLTFLLCITTTYNNADRGNLGLVNILRLSWCGTSTLDYAELK